MTDQGSEVLASVGASGPRRVFGVGVLAILGATLIYLVLDSPPSAEYAIFMALCGGGALWGAMRMWQATERRLVLTEAGVSDDTGLELAPFEDIERVDRGMLAFKPSNGFMLILKSKGPRHWAPGLYWRVGRRIGVGGVTSAAEAKVMADIIALRLSERDGI